MCALPQLDYFVKSPSPDSVANKLLSVPFAESAEFHDEGHQLIDNVEFECDGPTILVNLTLLTANKYQHVSQGHQYECNRALQ
jgi:hypothetical protein